MRLGTDLNPQGLGKERRTNRNNSPATFMPAETPAIPSERIERCILLMRGHKVMLDADLAELYGVSVKRLNEQVRRNIRRFPSDFMFRLSREEYEVLRSQSATLNQGRGRHRKYLPYAFTEQGVAMLSSVLNSDRAVWEVYPESQEQLCWNHKMLNVIDAVSKKEQVAVKKHLNAMMYADSRQEALKERKKFEQAFRHNPKAVKTVVENWERLTTYYDFPREHWKHLRTSNVVESPFSRVRLRTAASRRFKSQVNATCLIWKTMMVAEMSFRKLDAPHLVEKVVRGAKYDNGKEVRVAA
jgi:hypothetical protein